MVGGGDLRAGGTWGDLGYELTSSKAGIQDTSHNGNGRNLKVLYLFVNQLPRRLLGHTSYVQRRKDSSTFFMGLSSSAKAIRSVTRVSSSSYTWKNGMNITGKGLLCASTYTREHPLCYKGGHIYTTENSWKGDKTKVVRVSVELLFLQIVLFFKPV